MTPVNTAREAAALAVIERLQHRDPVALSELYDLYGALTYSLILGIVRDNGIAEDLTQETFLRIWARASLFNSSKGAVAPWLLSIAKHRALDHLRSSHGRWKTRIAELLEIEDPKLFADLQRSISGASLGGALKKLNSKQRCVIDLAYYKEYSQSEMAAKLGQPLGTVKSWMRSALKSLRRDLTSLPRHR